MQRVTGLPDEQVLIYEARIEALVRVCLDAVMDKIARRIEASMPVLAAALVAADEPASPPEPEPLPPGQPYVSPDDLASISPLWQQAVADQIAPLAAQIFLEAAGRTYANMVEASSIAGLPSVGSLAAEQYLAQAANTFDQVGDHLWAEARTQLLDGFERGESIPQLAARLRASAGLTARTGVLVARTQVIEASNAGSFATAQASGLQMQKEWIATPDLRTRPTHLAADGQRVGLNDPFIVGGFSGMFPAAPTFPPAERYSCRCTTGYVMPDRAPAQVRAQDAQVESMADLPGTTPAEALPKPAAPDGGIPDLGPDVPADLSAIRSSLVRAGSPDELRTAWQDEMRRITGRDIIVQLPPSMSPLTMREYAEGVCTMLERFPEARLRKISWWDDATSPNYARVTPGSASIEFNAYWAGEAQRRALLRSLRGDVAGWAGPERVGWSVRGAARPQATSFHEFAHIIDIETLGDQAKHRAQAIVRRRAAIEGIGDDELVMRDISAYAASGGSHAGNELIAEAVTDVMVNGSRASATSREIYDLIVADYRAKGLAIRQTAVDVDLEDLGDRFEDFPKSAAPSSIEEMAGLTPISRRPLEGGITAKVEEVTYPGGRRAVEKDYGRPDLTDQRSARIFAESETNAEILAADVLRVVGVRRPDVARLSDHSILMEFVEGAQGGQTGVLTAPAAIVRSAEGRRLGLADALMGHRDRGGGNWMRAPDGGIVAIDNGGAFGGSERAAAGNPFTSYLMGRYEESPWKTRIELPSDIDLAQIRRGLLGLRSRFEATGTAGRRQFKEMMDRLDEIERRAVPVDPAPSLVRAAVVRPAPRPPATAEDLARSRQAAIDQRRAVAQVLAEVDELVANGAFRDVILRGLKAKATQVDLPKAQLAPLVRAVESGDLGKVRRALDSRAKAAGLEPGSPAGTVVTFDRTLHQALPGSRIADGQRVVIVRRGDVADIDGERVALGKATVEEVSDADIARWRTGAQTWLAELTDAVESRAGADALREIVARGPSLTAGPDLPYLVDALDRAAGDRVKFAAALRKAKTQLGDGVKPVKATRAKAAPEPAAPAESAVPGAVLESVDDFAVRVNQIQGATAPARKLKASIDAELRRQFDLSSYAMSTEVRGVRVASPTEWAELGRRGIIREERTHAAYSLDDREIIFSPQWRTADGLRGAKRQFETDHLGWSFPDYDVATADYAAGVLRHEIGHAVSRRFPTVERRTAEGDIFAEEWTAGQRERFIHPLADELGVRRPGLGENIDDWWAESATQAAARRKISGYAGEANIQEAMAEIWASYSGRGELATTLIQRIGKAMRDEWPSPAAVATPEGKALVRAAARERNRLIESSQGTGRLLAEVDELIANKATKAALRQRLDPALIAPEQVYAGADPAVLEILRTALDTGDMAKLRAAVTRAGTKAKLKGVSKAGAKTTFDPETMDGVGGIEIAPGTPVTVVRRGTTLTLPDKTAMQLTRAQVTPVVKATKRVPTPIKPQTRRQREATLRKLADREPAAPPLELARGSADTDLLTYADESQAVRKIYRRGKPAEIKAEVDAEVLGSAVVDAIGVRSPVALSPRAGEVLMERLNGKTWEELLRDPGRPDLAALVDSVDGRGIGLADLITMNVDRNEGGWLVMPGGRLGSIDHGFSFGDAEYRNPRNLADVVDQAQFGELDPFVFHYVDRSSGKDVLREVVDTAGLDLSAIKRRLQALKPLFVAQGRADWHEGMMARFAEIEKRSKPKAALRPAEVKAGEKTLDERAAILDRQRKTIAADAVPERNLGGLSADTLLYRTPDGDLIVSKAYGRRMQLTAREAKALQDAEDLGGSVLDAVGVRAPATSRAKTDLQFFEYLEGPTGEELGEAAQRILIESDDGRLMGIADYLMINSDRNTGNYLRMLDGRLAGLDHGSAFWSHKDVEIDYVPLGSEFAEWLRAGPTSPGLADRLDIDPRDLAVIRRRLEALRPRFTELSRSAWFNAMMRRMKELEKRAVGTTQRLATS